MTGFTMDKPLEDGHMAESTYFWHLKLHWRIELFEASSNYFVCLYEFMGWKRNGVRSPHMSLPF